VTLSDSQKDIQETVGGFEEIEGIADQHLNGVIDGQHAQHTDQPANEDVGLCGYSFFIEYLDKQLSPTNTSKNLKTCFQP
jgi:hypothetical protein